MSFLYSIFLSSKTICSGFWMTFLLIVEMQLIKKMKLKKTVKLMDKNYQGYLFPPYHIALTHFLHPPKLLTSQS